MKLVAKATITLAYALSGMAAPLAAQQGTAVVADAPAAPLSLRSSTVYVYNFLDVRENEFTPKVLGELDIQLVAALQAHQVGSRMLRFKQTMIGMTFASMQSAAMIPVQEVIAANKTKEAESGARYRLVVFPADFLLMGAWRHYTVRWVLFDAASDEMLWSSDYKGKHMVMWKNSEGAAKRGKKLVDHLIAELTAKKLI